MKRILSFVMVCVSVVCLASCSWSLDDGVGNVTDETSKTELADQPDKEYKHQSHTSFSGTLMTAKGFLLFKQRSMNGLVTYNPALDTAQFFCYDPSCDHTIKSDCMMQQLRTSSDFTYYDGYIYLKYAEPYLVNNRIMGLARMSLDGSDLEVIYQIDPKSIMSMKAWNGYLYMLMVENTRIYRYNIATGEVDTMEHDEYSHYNGFAVVDEGIILHCADGKIRLSDHELRNQVELFPFCRFAYCDGIVYHAVNEKNGDVIASASIFAYDLSAKEDKLLAEFDGSVILTCADPDNAYAFKQKKEKQGGVSRVVGGELYRINRETEETTTVFSSDKIRVDSMYCIDGQLYAEMYTDGNYDSWLPDNYSKKTSIFGKMIEKDDGMLEFEPFEWILPARMYE